ncbi:MAG: NAD(P)-dependent oxidoreductase [Geminicoccaceae bacterium]
MVAEQKIWERPIKSVGVIGLTGVGRAICQRLARDGQPFGIDHVAAYDAEASALGESADTEVVVASSIADLVDMVDLVLLCLPGPGDVGRIARSHEGLLDCVREGQIIVDHGWSSFDLTRQLATAFSARNAAFLDAPIGNAATVEQAIDLGKLAFSIGGDTAATEAVLPLLGCFAGDITHVGAAGAAQVVRQVGDLVTLQTFAALGEGLMTAQAFGVEEDRLFDALAKGNGEGFGIGRHGPSGSNGGDAAAAQQTSIAEAGRRLGEAIQLAKGKNLSLTGADSTMILLEKAMENGIGEKDLSGLFGAMKAEIEQAERPGRPRG